MERVFQQENTSKKPKNRGGIGSHGKLHKLLNSSIFINNYVTRSTTDDSGFSKSETKPTNPITELEFPNKVNGLNSITFYSVMKNYYFYIYFWERISTPMCAIGRVYGLTDLKLSST